MNKIIRYILYIILVILCILGSIYVFNFTYYPFNPRLLGYERFNGGNNLVCGYPIGKVPVIDVTRGDITKLITATQIKHTWSGAPFGYIQLMNFNLGTHSVTMQKDGVNTCKIVDASDPYKLKIIDAYNGLDLVYTIENGTLMASDKHGRRLTIKV